MQAAAVTPRAIKTELAQDEVRKFAQLADYVCRARKPLLQSAGNHFIVQGSAGRFADCAQGTRHLEVTDSGGAFSSGLSFSFEVTPAGAIKAWMVTQAPPTMAAIGSLPTFIPARIELSAVQQALSEAVGAWMKYPVPAS